MPDGKAQIIVAGHVCLDVIPTFTPGRDEASPLKPGDLVNVGPAVMSTGGAVSNVGLALHRLGVPVRLIGKLGDDLFGDQVVRLFNAAGPGLADGMRRVAGEVTSYSVVINPPGVDRTFLHCPGANDTFTAADVDAASLAGSTSGGARLLHFGYPPIMRRMFLDGGVELATLLRRVRDAGLTVSLDMSMVDANSEAGRVDWAKLLAGALPHVDVFCPSYDELLFMLDRPATPGTLDASTLTNLADRCIAMGAAIVAIKLGDQGLYLRTTDDRARLAAAGLAAPDAAAWADRELHAPCFAVGAVGTTGAGDATIAGLLAALLRGDGPDAAVRAAVAVGASSVEAPDAVSGVSPWPVIAKRIAAGWPVRPSVINLTPGTTPRPAPSR